jgi:very-short-patch-repair endonuclease
VRNVTHYDINVVHAIAIRAQRFGDFNAFLAAVQDYGISTSRTYTVLQRQERGFASLMLKLLDGITVVQTQYHVGPYLVDFYLPDFRVAIEYDEAHHHKPANQKADGRRQKRIQRQTGCTFVRVSGEDEIAGINKLLRLIWNHSRHSSVSSSKNS